MRIAYELLKREIARLERDHYSEPPVFIGAQECSLCKRLQAAAAELAWLDKVIPLLAVPA